MLSNQQIQNNWPTIKSQILSKWNKLSEVEVERTHGNPSKMEELVHARYGRYEEFDSAYERICKTSVHSSRNTSTSEEKKFSQKQADGVPDFENRSRTTPSAEAGMNDDEFDSSYDDTFHSGSPERRANANYSQIENDNDFINIESSDELSHYGGTSRSSVIDDDTSDIYKLNNNESNTHFSAPDEFYPSQDPSSGSKDIPLGRKISSATKISTAKAASISSEASNDAKKKV